VKIAEVNARARAEMVAQGKIGLKNRVRNNLLARSELLGILANPVAPLANTLLSNPLVRAVTEAALGIHHEAPLPSFSKQRFTDWFKHRDESMNPTDKVVYFHGCSTQYYEPRVGKAAVQVLEANGFEVVVPPQNCCGLPLLSNGEFPAARRYHQSNVRSLVEYVRQGIPILGTSTSCILTLKEEAPELLEMFDQETRLVAENTYDLSEFLLMLLDRGKLAGVDGKQPAFKPLPLTLAYHAPCQYRAHRLGKPSLEVLGLIPELEIIDSQAPCCGIAGTYGYKKEKYQVAMDVGQALFDFVRGIPGPLAVCDSETCRWQITHGTGIPSLHPVELLAAAYGYPVEGELARVIAPLSGDGLA
jgi:glycerol-3-phosphate dehydrogenase subunit C